MKNALLMFAAAILIAGVVCAQETSTDKVVTGGDELVQEKGVFAGTWIRPDADITRYTKLYLWESVFQFREGGEKSTGTTIGMSRGDTGPYAVTEDSKEKFKEVVVKAVVKELARSKMFEMVGEVGPGTLIVRAAVLDIVSWVPPNASRAGNIHLAAVGEATFVFELIDAETGVIQARVAERRTIQPPGRVNTINAAPTNAASVWNDVERWAREEAQTLRKALEKAKKKAT